MKAGRLALGLGALYLAQGLVYGSQSTLVRIAAASGRSLEYQTDLIAWSLAPWVLKFAWGVLQDRLLPRASARHARVLIGLQLAVAFALLAVAARVSGSEVVLLLFVLNLILSWQDVATDAFAVDHIPASLRGRINAVMAGLRAFGATVVGGILFVAALPVIGVERFLYLIAVALGLLGLAPLLLTSQARLTERGEAPRPLDWIAGLRVPLVCLCLLMLFGDGLGSAVSAEFLLNAAGWSLDDLVNKLQPTAVVAELIGFGLAAAFVDRIGPRQAVAGGAAALGLVWALLGSITALWFVHEVFYVITAIEGLGRAFLMVGVYALCMAGVDERLRATQFLVYMALINLGSVLGTVAAPRVFAAGSFSGVWLTAAGLQALLVVLALDRRSRGRVGRSQP